MKTKSKNLHYKPITGQSRAKCCVCSAALPINNLYLSFKIVSLCRVSEKFVSSPREMLFVHWAHSLLL